MSTQGRLPLRAAAVKRTRRTAGPPQLPGFEDAGGPARKAVHSVPKRRAMGGTPGTMRGQPFLPGFNPNNAPGSPIDVRRTVMTPKRMAGIDAARARSASLKAEREAIKQEVKLPTRMSRKSIMGIGLGIGVAAAVAMNRRGEGASSGRQSAYRY